MAASRPAAGAADGKEVSRFRGFVEEVN